jgi:cell division protein FtsL
MIQDRTYPLPSARNLHVRQRAVRTTAQYALHFGLGVALVSLVAGLSVVLAGQTAALQVQTRTLEAQCRQTEWENSELIAILAKGTSIERVDSFADAHGFTENPQLVVLPQRVPEQHIRIGHVSQSRPDTAMATDQGASQEAPLWEGLFHRLLGIRSLVQG